MGFLFQLSDNLPAFLISLVLALLGAVFGLAAMFLVAGHYALGLDFGIIWGICTAAVVGLSVFFLVFRKICPSR